MKQSSKNEKNGFTLIDTIIGIALLGVAVLIFSLFLPGLALSGAAKNQAIAIAAAQQKIEELRTIPFDALTVQENTGFTSIDVEKLRNGVGVFTIDYFDANQDGIANENIKLIQVEVSWLQKNDNRSISFSTLVTETGLNKLE